MILTLVGRYKCIISESLAVLEVLGIPFAFPPNAPMGESISIGVEAMAASCEMNSESSGLLTLEVKLN